MVDLSGSARTILRHFKVRGMHEKDYETPPLWDSYLITPRSVSLPKPNW
jgi:hypothetical protein